MKAQIPPPRTYHQDERATLILGDSLQALQTLPDGSVDCIVTSPPYFGLRDYGEEGQYGQEATPSAYSETMRQVFSEARRALADDGTLWLNLGDSYSVRWGSERKAGRSGLNNDDDTRDRSGAIKHGVPEKNLIGTPWRVAFALQDDGWILRNAVVWHKTNAMPTSVRDRLSNKYENLFLFSKNKRYWFDLDAIREPHTMRPQRRGATVDYRPPGALNAPTGAHRKREGRSADGHPLGKNPGDVWSIPTRPYSAAHFAVFPPDLPLRCIKAGCKPGGVVLDPFSGSGTTGGAALLLDRRYIGIDLNGAYHDLALDRFSSTNQENAA